MPFSLHYYSSGDAFCNKTQEMSLNTDITRSRSQHAEQNSQKPSWGPDSVPSQGRPASHPSSDSASTSTTVTTSENSNRTTAKLPDYGIIPGARPLIVRRRSRPKLEGQRSSRSDRELSSREAVRKTTDGSCGGLARRENPPDIAVADQSRRDKGKAVIRSAHTPSTRRPLPESPMFSSSDNSSFSGQPASAEFERLKEEIDLWKKAATDNKKQAKKHAMVCHIALRYVINSHLSGFFVESRGAENSNIGGDFGMASLSSKFSHTHFSPFRRKKSKKSRFRL